MSLVLDILAWAALLAGGAFVIIAAGGIPRLPDVFTRTHATSLRSASATNQLGNFTTVWRVYAQTFASRARR